MIMKVWHVIDINVKLKKDIAFSCFNILNIYHFFSPLKFNTFVQGIEND